MIDTSPIHSLARELIDKVEEECDGFVRTVAIVVEVDEGDRTHMFRHCSDDRAWFRGALFEEAARTDRRDQRRAEKELDD